GTVRARKGDGLVCGARIDNKDSIGDAADRSDCSTNVLRFIERQDHNRQRHGALASRKASAPKLSPAALLDPKPLTRALSADIGQIIDSKQVPAPWSGQTAPGRRRNTGREPGRRPCESRRSPFRL